MSNWSDFPLLPGEANGSRETFVVDSITDLNEIGKSAGQFALHKGDTIVFDNECVNESGEPLAKKQATSTAGTYSYYIACKRNGVKSFLSVASLRRRNIKSPDGFVCPWMKQFDDILRSSNFTEAYNAMLKGKTITSSSTVEAYRMPYGNPNGEPEKHIEAVID